MSVENVREYGKNLEEFGKLLQDENTTIFDLVKSAEKCNMTIAITTSKMKKENDVPTEENKENALE